MPSDIQAQIERRRQRAQEEIVRVTNTGNHPVFSSFDVKSVSGQVHRVDIESLDELRNTCTCPDYASNLIGTRKHIHIEGVLLHLNRTHGRRLPAVVVQTELIEPGRLPDDLALQLERVDALAAPRAAGAASPAPPLSAAAAGKILVSLRALVDLARQRVISAAL